MTKHTVKNLNQILVRFYRRSPKFNLDCGVHKNTNGPRLYIFSTSKERFIELIKPYIISHFSYKFDLD
jgi:hypothetical protein